MEMASHFVCGKGDVPDIYTKPLAAHWFPGNVGDNSELSTAILFPHLMNFVTVSHCCVQTACRMDLFTKAKDAGIQTEFIDGQGHRHVTGAEALKIILDAMPVCTENLNPNVLTMKSAQYRARIYDARSLNLARDRRILVQ